ncbi:T9SS type A sorting domain-containing protein [Fluviicola sp.]|uniref:T9SS type A sorting domain-containing protein n=1 Tax=Fluviicola sp. TaxID=1917219 RepID=UPI0028195287|nr:T9SS type A sorting domain-containing protein [Fluviicola sp.]MDR0801902.1 T9SS type A sorting domain-containing protein [Fluviicola sp.]
MAQCANGSGYGEISAPTSGTTTISTCSYQQEYSTIDDVAAYKTYSCTISGGGYITVRIGAPNGPVIAYGSSPLTWNSTIAGTYYAHWNTNASCGTASNCETTSVSFVGNAPLPSCPQSSTPTLSATSTEINLSWNAGGTESSWNIEWGVPGFTPGTGTELGSATASTESYSIINLNPSTNYDIYVQANCGSDSSLWTFVSGVTLCAPVTNLPWNENFDAMANTDYELFPNCWMDEYGEWFTDNTSNNVSFSFSHPYSGSNFLGIFYGSDDYIWTPEFQLTAGKLYEFSFMWASDSYSGWYGEVLVNSSQSSLNAVALGTEFITPADVFNTDYRKAVYCFEPDSSGIYSFAIHVSSDYNPYNLTFDDFSLFERGTSAGTNGASNVCQTEGLVDLNAIITKNDLSGSWSFAGNSSAVINDSMFNPQFVPAGIIYVNYITTGCLKDTATAAISIYAPSSAGTDGIVTVCKNEPINLLEGLGGNVNMGGSWYNSQNQLMSTSQIMAPNFSGQYNYEYITGNGICPDDTSSVVVTVTSCDWLSVDEIALDQINIYPNPSMGIVFIESDFSGSFDLVVMDINGRIVETGNNSIVAGTNTVDLSKVEKGTYFFKLSSEIAEKVYRVVIAQ